MATPDRPVLYALFGLNRAGKLLDATLIVLAAAVEQALPVAAIEIRNVALMTYLEERGAREKP